MDAWADGSTEPVIRIYWIPLGAGGSGFVRWNGRIYERFSALRERRTPCALYHTALDVIVPDGRYTIETAWPSPDADTASRGVAYEGPVFSRRLAGFRPFRYEVRCWLDGVIPDVAYAIGGPQRVSDDPAAAQRLLELVEHVPHQVWGRDEAGADDMWNSNSVVSWLLAGSGVDTDPIGPPSGGRAPGWLAGIAAAATS
jgi:hypothetical protein